MKKWICTVLLGGILLPISQTAFSATYLGTWDLRGTGSKDMVYREGNSVRIIDAGGSTRDYPVGNIAWSLVDAKDTDGKAGLELVLRAGNDLLIIDHAYQTQRTYSVGNISWAVMDISNLNARAGAEVLVSMGGGIRIIEDAQRTYRDVNFNYNGSWSLFGISNLSGNGPDLVLNMGNGVKLIDPRTFAVKDFTFQGYSAIYGISQLDSTAGLEVIGRTAGTVYVIKGGVKSGTVKEYPATTSSSWAIYGRTADTDGKAGDEIILVMQGLVRIISHSDGYARDYPIPSTNYTIDSISNMDGNAGNEIVARDGAGLIYIINDKLRTIQRR